MSSPGRKRDRDRDRDRERGDSRESHGNSQGQQQQQTPHSSPGHRSDFASTLKKWNAPVPPVLRKIGRVSDSPLGKVKVMLKVCDMADDVGGSGILGVDQRKKQVTLIDPGGSSTPAGITPEERRVGVSAPKMFAFDGIFGEDDDQAEICAASAAELVASVVGGEDGCFVSLGYCTTGKNSTMFGRPVNQKMGVVPTAVSWLFKSIQEQRQKTGSRFSVRVSAVEVTGGSSHEVINDLLRPFAKDGDQSPGHLLDSSSGSNGGSGGGSGSSGYKNSSSAVPVLNNVSEVRAPNPETAGFYLDAALDAMKKEDPVRHFVFTLNVYQYTVDKNGKGAVVGGRSRLHCVMLGNGSPSISVLGGLLLAVLNGQRHLPSRDSKLGAILRECLGSLTCRAVVMIHISSAHSRYAETLAALQLGSRVHRLRRSRRLKMGSVGSGNGSGGSSGGSGEEMRMNSSTVVGPASSLGGLCEGEAAPGTAGNSDIDPSSSEQSCDTVIYLGPSIDDATDGEHPPVYLPNLDGPGSSGGSGSGENGILSGKYSLTSGQSQGAPPKTKSPKPKSSSKGDSSNFSNGSSGNSNSNSNSKEEKWVDGPKVSKYRQSMVAAAVNGGSGSGTGGGNRVGGETWIDGPAARVHVHHQASNFPSPKKTPNLRGAERDGHSHKARGGGNNASILPPDPVGLGLGIGLGMGNGLCSTKAQMIQKWISNQSHAFLDDISSSSPDGHNSTASAFFGASVSSPSHSHNHHGHSQSHSHHHPNQQQYQNPNHIGGSSLYSNLPAASPFNSSSGGGDGRGDRGDSANYPYCLYPTNISIEPEYKALTVFKTCDDEDDLDEETVKDECMGFEFELIEVTEPEVPVPTRDACLQVTEEDIALSLSFLEEENPLPESDQNFTMASKASFFSPSSPASGTQQKQRGRSTSFSEGGIVPLQQQQQTCSAFHTPSSSCSVDSEKNEDHPLRVLSQECLTVISTFTDSMSIAGGDNSDLQRFWPRLSYTGSSDLPTNVQEIHEMGMCHGLCKNLVSLSQMSLTHHQYQNGGGGGGGHPIHQYSAALPPDADLQDLDYDSSQFRHHHHNPHHHSLNRNHHHHHNNNNNNNNNICKTKGSSVNAVLRSPSRQANNHSHSPSHHHHHQRQVSESGVGKLVVQEGQSDKIESSSLSNRNTSANTLTNGGSGGDTNGSCSHSGSTVDMMRRMKSPPPKTVVMDPPALSDESIFKIPKSPIQLNGAAGESETNNGTNTSCSNKSGKSKTGKSSNSNSNSVTSTPVKKSKDQSDAEQDSVISIPPSMKLLDLAPLQAPLRSSPTSTATNNNSNGIGGSVSPVPHSCILNENNCANSNSNSSGNQHCTGQLKSTTNLLQNHNQNHRGCDHNHHHHSNVTNGIATTTNTNTNANASTNSNPNPNLIPGSHSVASIPSSPSKMNGTRNGASPCSVIMETPPSSPSPLPEVTKSPSKSKSKSRKIAKFFRSRSKSPKTAGATSSSESGKSSVSSSNSKLKLSSSSSCSSASSSAPSTKPPNASCPSPKKSGNIVPVSSSTSSSSPSKKSIGSTILLSLPPQASQPVANGNGSVTCTNSALDYQFNCDSNSSLPLFAPTPLPQTITE